jgi:hypothetical protein
MNYSFGYPLFSHQKKKKPLARIYNESPKFGKSSTVD